MAIVPYTGADDRNVVGGHANSEEWNAITRLAEVGTSPLGFGQPAQRAADGFAELYDGGSFLGVTRYRIDIDGEDGYDQAANASIMTAGVMWVAAGDTATAGEPAGFDPATDRWADVGDDYVNVPGVEFDNDGADGGLVKIRIQKQPAAVPAG